MKMNVLSGGRLRMRKSVYLPDAQREETIDLPVACHLLRHPQGNVLFDTGCHPSVAADAEGRWGSLARAMTWIGGPDEHVVAQLGTVGLSPDDIDVVVNSHLHTDHCGCNAFFRKASFVCHAKELEAARGPEGVARGFFPQDWDHPMPFDAIDGERDLFGDGRIVLVPLPGHTPGMTGALVGLDRDGSFLLVSDAVPLRASLERDHNPRMTWDADRSSRSMQEVRRIEAGGATVVFGHDLAQWQTMRTGIDAYQ